MSGTRIAFIAASLVAAGVVSSAQAVNNARVEDRTAQPQYGPSAYAQLGRIYTKAPRIPFSSTANDKYLL